MLVLSRKLSERLVLCASGQTVVIEVVKIRGGRVHLGVCAPDHVTVHRQEVHDRIAGEHPAPGQHVSVT